MCLLGLGVACHCQYDDAQVARVIDLRTAYRKYIPEEFRDFPEPSSESRSVNITAVQIEKNKTFDGDWSAQRERGEFVEDSAISESGRKWLKRIHNRGKDSYSYEYNSSEWRKFEQSVERKRASEENNTDVFEEDISHLWDKYMANKTAPPGFNLAYSPRFMNRAYRRYSLSVLNLTLPTTQHWLNLPLTGDQGIKFDRAMERLRQFEINKKNATRIAMVDKFLEDQMKGKNLSRMKDIVRHYIGLRRRIGAQLNWTMATISISAELDKMKVPDTNEEIRKFQEQESEIAEVEPPDFDKIIKEMEERTPESEERVTQARVTQKATEATLYPPSPVSSIFNFKLNPGAFHVEPKQNPEDAFKPAGQESKEATKAEVKEEPPSEKPDVRQQPEHTASERPDSIEIVSTPHSKPESTRPPSSNNTLTNHPAAKFLHKHKNKFLIGGIACLVAAKILG